MPCDVAVSRGGWDIVQAVNKHVLNYSTTTFMCNIPPSFHHVVLRLQLSATVNTNGVDPVCKNTSEQAMLYPRKAAKPSEHTDA